MSEATYSIVFNGEILPGHDLEAVQSAMAKTFKLPPGQIVNFYIFGDPESDSPADSNIAWLLAVKDKDKGGSG